MRPDVRAKGSDLEWDEDELETSISAGGCRGYFASNRFDTGDGTSCHGRGRRHVGDNDGACYDGGSNSARTYRIRIERLWARYNGYRGRRRARLVFAGCDLTRLGRAESNAGPRWSDS